LHSTISSVGERTFIDRITARLSRPSWVRVGPGDDAAVVEPERGALEVLTTDVQVESVHFDRRFVPLDAVGHRALAANLSDLAAMGARPRSALLSLMLPDEFGLEDVDALMDGMLALADRHGVAIVGGNITRSPGPLVVDVTATGSVRPRRVLTRGGAHAGDDVYVTGTIGDAAVGLESLLSQTRARDERAEGPERHAVGAAPAVDNCEGRYLRPEPRVRAGMLLGRNRAASACMDASDGLADAVRQVARASGVGIVLEGDALPISEEVRRWHERRGANPLMASLAGGDDYELLFTARPAQRGRLREVRKLLGALPMTRIGTAIRDRRVTVRTLAGEQDLPRGFEHFT
jgi:thiamine-monophosphate kinase